MVGIEIDAVAPRYAVSFGFIYIGEGAIKDRLASLVRMDNNQRRHPLRRIRCIYPACRMPDAGDRWPGISTNMLL